MNANAAIATFRARESSREPPFIQNAVIRAVGGSHNVCWYALSHENGSKCVRHRFGSHFGILPFHTEEEKEEDIQGYICTPDFTEASHLWRIPPPSKGVSLPHTHVSSRETWVELDENKRTV